MKTSQTFRNLLLLILSNLMCISVYSQTLIKNLQIGENEGSDIKFLESVNNQLLFSAKSDGINNRLFKTNGTFEGTSIVHPLYKSNQGYESFLTVSDAFWFRNKLYLKITYANETNYWETDGTTEGTKLSYPIGECTVSPYNEFLRLNNSVFFRCELNFYKSDGKEYPVTADGFNFSNTKAIGEWSNHLLLSKNNRDLYITDSSPFGVKEITNPEVELYNNEAIGIDNLIYFSGKSNATGCELWCYSASKDSTYLVKDIEPGTSGSFPGGFIAVNGKAVFSVGLKTYVSDGTNKGTIPLNNLHIFRGGNNPCYINYKNRLFFSAQDGIHGYELWETDGTLEGTKMLKDINVGNNTSGSWPDCFIEYNGEIYFDAGNGEQNGIWKSDGTEEGTKPVLLNGSVTSFKISNNMLYAVYSDDSHGAELWVSDGTEEGFHLVRDINPNPYLASSATKILGEIDNKLIISSFANDTSYLSTSDGTTEGTSIYHKAYTHIPAYRLPVIKFGDKLFFEGINEVLWTTDGTQEGTIFNADISQPSNFFTFNNKIFFSAIYSRKNILFSSTEDISTAELFKWVEDPHNFIEYNNQFYFVANDNKEIWKSDGSVDGTYLIFSTDARYPTISNLTIFNDLLFFIAPSENASAALWSTDGTTEGTQKYLDNDGQEIRWPTSLTVFNSSLFFSDPEGFKRLNTNNHQSTRIGNKASTMLVIGNKMYYSSYTSPNEYEPWCSDGTVEGTYQITNQNGNISSNPHDFIGFGDKIYFTLFDEEHGRELWVSDGTESNAKLVFDANPGFGSGNTGNFTIFNSEFYFLADDGIHGKSLYKLTRSSTNNIAQFNTQMPRLHVYPNPFKDKTTVEFDNPDHRNFKLSVYNISGEKAFEINDIVSDHIELHRDNLKSGIYLIELKSESYRRVRKIIIK